MISTLSGPVIGSSLGKTLMHEHLFVTAPELRAGYPDRFDEEQEVERVVAEARQLVELGFQTVVDPTVLGMGRDVRLMKAVADGAGLNVVAATGMYVHNEAPFFAKFRGPKDALWPEPEEFLTELFISDLESGIGGTSMRAAFLKCAIDAHGLTPDVERVMRSVAQAHLATGAPIMIHTSAAKRNGLTAQAVMVQERVDPRALVIGHCGDSTDIEYLTQIMENGSMIGMDRFGWDALLALDDRLSTVAELCKRGYAKQMVLAHDAVCSFDWAPESSRASLPVLTYIPTRVVPGLMQLGVTDEDLNAMLVDAPRRFFEPSVS